MRVDAAIDLVSEFLHYGYRRELPSNVVLAETNWLAYVQAMAASLPDDDLTYPTEQDVLWAWPDGVLIVFDGPLRVQHTIISNDAGPTTPHPETHDVVAVAVMSKRPVRARVEGEWAEGVAPETIIAHPTLWIGTNPGDIVTGHWLPGLRMRASHTDVTISHSTRMLVSMITALGHRLTRVAMPTGTRGERRRAERALPNLRVLELASGATVKSDTTGTVEWSKRWMVRGHWRLQPHGPGRTLRKAIWIDPFVKGPADKPLDVRPTVWVQR